MKPLAKLWIVADRQAADGYFILQNLCTNNAVDKKPLYIYQKYKVQFRVQQPYVQENNPLKRLQQVLYESFNNAKLPRHLIIMLDEAIVRFSNVNGYYP